MHTYTTPRVHTVQPYAHTHPTGAHIHAPQHGICTRAHRHTVCTTHRSTQTHAMKQCVHHVVLYHMCTYMHTPHTRHIHAHMAHQIRPHMHVPAYTTWTQVHHTHGLTCTCVCHRCAHAICTAHCAHSTYTTHRHVHTCVPYMYRTCAHVMPSHTDVCTTP